jgi:hypothetical protein
MLIEKMSLQEILTKDGRYFRAESRIRFLTELLCAAAGMISDCDGRWTRKGNWPALERLRTAVGQSSGQGATK